MVGIIKRPILTEKMTTLAEGGQYAFKVDINANKIEIAKAIEKRFNVNIISIRTMRVRGKAKAQFTKKGRFEGRRPHWKKAVVTLKKGETIELIET
jgi:large subunit ribosomal protein L23